MCSCVHVLVWVPLLMLPSQNCTWSMGSVGRAQLTLQKGEPGSWPRLLKTAKKPGNMHVWWEMAEKYEQENKAKDDELKAVKSKKEKVGARLPPVLTPCVCLRSRMCSRAHLCVYVRVFVFAYVCLCGVCIAVPCCGPPGGGSSGCGGCGCPIRRGAGDR